MEKRRGIEPPAIATEPEVFAVRACINGEATGEQQMLAMNWIMREASRVTDLSYVPGDPYAAAFNEGRRYAGICIRVCLEPQYLKEAKQRDQQQRQGK